MIKLDVNRLTSAANNAPIPNQNIKKPTVIISPIKNNPAIINQICHIKTSPFIKDLHINYTIN